MRGHGIVRAARALPCTALRRNTAPNSAAKGRAMDRVGDVWVPAIDTHWFKNRRKTQANFAGGGLGRDIGNLDGAVAAMVRLVGAPALAAASAVDAGANVGAYSRRMVDHFARVHAFEPASDTFACLARNAADWGLAGRLIAYPYAVSDRREGVRMAAGGFLRRSVARQVSGPGDVAAIPLDDLGLADCLFLKLDVEGYEVKALSGARSLIARCRPFVMVEQKERHRERDEGLEGPVGWLRAQGYRDVARLGNPAIDLLLAPAERLGA